MYQETSAPVPQFVQSIQKRTPTTTYVSGYHGHLLRSVDEEFPRHQESLAVGPVRPTDSEEGPDNHVRLGPS